MRIDETHRPWLIITLIIMGISTVGYVPYAWFSHPGGGTAIGLTYGIAGYAMMIFAGLLSIRKKFRVARIGRAKVWMRGHIWLGFLAFPLILYHAAFGLGGPLTKVLMLLFVFVWVSGIVGAVLQHYMPVIMTREVPMETIYDQIDTVLGQLCSEADDIMVQLVPAMEALPVPEIVGDRTITRTMPLTQVARDVDSKSLQPIRSLYADKVQPYLLRPGNFKHELANVQMAGKIFETVRQMSPGMIDPFVDDLENICDEKRQLDKQVRLHKILYGWLFVHLPLSWALLVLGAVHAVIALRY
jgi:hypothetical protein